MNRKTDDQHLSKRLTVLIFTESSVQLSSDNRSRSLTCRASSMEGGILSTMKNHLAENLLIYGL